MYATFDSMPATQHEHSECATQAGLAAANAMREMVNASGNIAIAGGASGGASSSSSGSSGVGIGVDSPVHRVCQELFSMMPVSAVHRDLAEKLLRLRRSLGNQLTPAQLAPYENAIVAQSQRENVLYPELGGGTSVTTTTTRTTHATASATTTLTTTTTTSEDLRSPFALAWAMDRYQHALVRAWLVQRHAALVQVRVWVCVCGEKGQSCVNDRE